MIVSDESYSKEIDKISTIGIDIARYRMVQDTQLPSIVILVAYKTSDSLLLNEFQEKKI
jgi:hypothetical protein